MKSVSPCDIKNVFSLWIEDFVHDSDVLKLISVLTQSTESTASQIYSVFSSMRLETSNGSLIGLIEGDLPSGYKDLLQGLDNEMTRMLGRVYPHISLSTQDSYMETLIVDRRNYIDYLYTELGKTPNIDWPEIEKHLENEK